MSDNQRNQRIFETFKIKNKDIKRIGKHLGKGGFGEVKEILMDNNKLFAGKLIEKKKRQKAKEEEYGINIRGKNIVNINKIMSNNVDGKDYLLIIMEKCILRDLGTLNNFFCDKNLLKTINKPFYETLGDNLLRFYTKQIINALELLNRNYYVHNDIKPQNILIGDNLTLKLTDFGLLRKVQDKPTIIPGGTSGYLSPEYYINKEVNSEIARKQDYFALGSTLYFLKYGKKMLNPGIYNNNDKIIISDEIIKLLEQNRDNIKSGKTSDGEFIKFLCSLIEFKPEDRMCFEEIYRNIWLNNNSKQINNIHSIHQREEEKLIMELQKSDFLILKEKENEQKSK